MRRGIEKLYLSGITGRPPQAGHPKTALGAEETVPWEHTWEPVPLLALASANAGCEIAAIETSVHAVDLFDWTPRFPGLRGLRPRGGRRSSRNSRPCATRTSASRCSGRSTR